MRLRRFVLVVQYLTLAACAVTVVMLFVYDPAPEAIVMAEGDAGLGAAVFASRCAGCHGTAGEGGYGPALAGGVVLVSYPEVEAQIAFVSEGTGTMPGFAGDLSAGEIEAVVAFTREDLAGAGDAGSAEPIDDPEVAAVGAQVYADTCTGCHGDDGEGGFGPELAGGAAITAYPDAADQIAVVEAGRGAMPSYEGDLTPEQIAAVVAYTRSLP